MKKILISIATIGIIGVVAFAASQAFFSDTEKSTGNKFVAGAIDLQIDSTCTYNDVQSVQCGTWNLTDLTSEKFFNFTDVKPGDKGENTISLHVYDNDAYACVSINPTLNDDVSSTEPELVVDVENTDSIFDGELAQNMHFIIWADMCNEGGAKPGDNILQEWCDEPILTKGDGPITPRTWTLADPSMNVFTGVAGPLEGSHDYFLGVEWSIPTIVGNIIQTDKYMADVSFYVEQSRNNGGFVCKVQEGFPTNTLRLENEEEVEGAPWTVLSEDGIFADLTWDGDGSNFVYDLHAQGLPVSTDYSLIYYADGWPGNNPGALIGTHTTDGSGKIDVDNVVKNLDMDLPSSPDGNLAIGAKIWLIPSTAYNATTNSVITWPPNFDTWLFEGNVYIHYEDTDLP